MTMSFSLQESFGFGEMTGQIEKSPIHVPVRKDTKDDLHIFVEKIRLPQCEKTMPLPRLTELLTKSSSQFGATLITGRAGTGKTSLAKDFAHQYKKVSWYSIEAADCDWRLFSTYLTAAVLGEYFDRTKLIEKLSLDDELKKSAISAYLTGIFSEIGVQSEKEPVLIVLDDLHHIFDCDWFSDFFNLLLYSLLPNIHLLLLCRSKPALPLWRLRSKQVLNVIDEKLLALNFDETEKLYENLGLSKEHARKGYRESFGRVSKLMHLVNYNLTQNLPGGKASGPQRTKISSSR